MATTARLKIEYRDPRHIKVARRNARTHSKKQIEQLRLAIERFGFTNPVLVDEKDRLIAGHGRREAALDVTIDGEMHMALAQVPVIVLRGLSDQKKRELALADNRIAENSGWDSKLLALELRDLEKADDFDPAALGFGDRELKGLLEGVAAEPPATYESEWAVVVELKDERAQVALLKRLKKEGFKCKALVG